MRGNELLAQTTSHRVPAVKNEKSFGKTPLIFQKAKEPVGLPARVDHFVRPRSGVAKTA